MRVLDSINMHVKFRKNRREAYMLEYTILLRMRVLVSINIHVKFRKNKKEQKYKWHFWTQTAYMRDEVKNNQESA